MRVGLSFSQPVYVCIVPSCFFCCPALHPLLCAMKALCQYVFILIFYFMAPFIIALQPQGISRSQATLRVCASTNRVLVTHRRGAVNGIRIIRWAGSPGLASDEKAARQAKTKTASPASAAAKVLKTSKVLDRGQCDYLYPGDSIQLDGFRARDASTCSYVLHPLPPGWCRPARGGGRSSPASASASAGTASARGSGSGGGTGPRPATGKIALARTDSGGKGAEASSSIIARRRASSPGREQGVSSPSRGRAIHDPTGIVTRREPPAALVPEPGAFQTGAAAAASAPAEVEAVAAAQPAASEVAATAATTGSLRLISAETVASAGKCPSPNPTGRVGGSRLSPLPAAASGVGVGVKRSGSPGVARGSSSGSGEASRVGAVPAPIHGDTAKKLRMSPGGASAGGSNDGDLDNENDGVSSVLSPPSSFSPSVSPSPASEKSRVLSEEASRATPSPGGGGSSVVKTSKKRPSPSAEEKKEEQKEEGKGDGDAGPGSSAKAPRRGDACTPDGSGTSSVCGSGIVSPREVEAASMGSTPGATEGTSGAVAAAAASVESIERQVSFLPIFGCSFSRRHRC